MLIISVTGWYSLNTRKAAGTMVRQHLASRSVKCRMDKAGRVEAGRNDLWLVLAYIFFLTVCVNAVGQCEGAENGLLSPLALLHCPYFTKSSLNPQYPLTTTSMVPNFSTLPALYITASNLPPTIAPKSYSYLVGLGLLSI
jgi:hypothetical protein